MDMFFTQVLGKNGVILAVGLLIFFYAYKNSIKLFDWIETQTFGTRDYILNKLEFLHIEIEERKITYVLLFLAFGLSALIFSFCALYSRFGLGVFLAVVFTILGWKIPKPFINFLVERRVKKYQGQMVDALNLLSNGLRAGLSVPQSLGLVVGELPPPVSEEFNTILQQSKIGVPIDECFENLKLRIPTEDNEMFVTSVNILRETGGNLAETFDTITEVIRERIRLQQKIETYIAQGKFQGGVIAAMPTGMLLVYSVSDPDLVATMFTSPVGIIMLVVAYAFNIVGALAIMKVIKIKV